MYTTCYLYMAHFDDLQGCFNFDLYSMFLIFRDIFAENDLDKQTLDAQQEEAERRKRILEVQKALEEQRKKEKEENDSQLKSLLQSKSRVKIV